ncbi:aminotransferase class III-fold pyridoxal phosphate-dependent enzyme [Alkalilimnicola ehrlichii]|uniref:aminotransferase class III-fold pyridoxal phosphate-dependent enzyme n=1 Tax=Alkalilimnicola ehrlichii TaxID=351052 RepID=UPI0028693252|nr:aminotransferase class III-fold pyridoxal phosphate-dependent enzyme [Alkalilimnicola ehrlichii]
MRGGVHSVDDEKPEHFAPGRFPIYLASGSGALVTDVDGNQFIDYICGLGANTLGHNHPVVIDALNQHLGNGLLHSLPAPVEVQAAKCLVGLIPGAEMVRFFKTGADANSAAIRLARSITEREKIVTVGYNGWHDQYMFDTPGVPAGLKDYTYRMPLFSPDDEQPLLDLVEQKGSELAAVLLSVPYNRVLSRRFIQQLRLACRQQGVLFVIDEVVTGFRLALGGAQEFFKVDADLVTLSKGIAAGMPLSAVAGRRELMQEMERLQVSTTFGGELLSLEVCRAVLQTYAESDYIDRLAKLGQRLKEGVNTAAERLGAPLRVVGYDPIPMFLFSRDPAEHAAYAIEFVAQMARRGVLLRRDVNFISGVHTEPQIDFTVNAVVESLQTMIADGVIVAQVA